MGGDIDDALDRRAAAQHLYYDIEHRRRDNTEQNGVLFNNAAQAAGHAGYISPGQFELGFHIKMHS